MKKVIFIIIMALLLTRSVLAQNKILINEFLIDPQPQQVEIINISTEEADISGWYIDDSGGTTYYTIPQSTILYPNSCLVFSDDFNLNKSSADTVRLFTNKASPISSGAEIVDFYSYKSSPGTNISFLRLPDADKWTTGSASLGFFNQSGFSCIVTPTPTEIPTPTPTTFFDQAPTITPIQEVTQTPQSYSNIFISEVMVNPESGNKEWVEIYNANDYSVSLTDWFIDDLENAGSVPKTFSLEIPAKSYRVFYLTSSMFNNDGDSVRLLDSNRVLQDSFEYTSSAQGKTYGRVNFDTDDFCLGEPSPEVANNSCLNPTPTIAPTQKPTNTLSSLRPTLKTNLSTNSNSAPKPNNLVIQKKIIPSESLPGEILGESAKNTNNNNSFVKTLSFISLSYSLLTLISVLIKMKSIYAKIGGFFSSFVYSS